MSRTIGIDLGTTNSLVATVDSGIPLVIADADGHRLTPSVVHFAGASESPVAGLAAARMRVVSPAQTVYSVKRFMGRRGEELTREELQVNYPIRGEGKAPASIPIHGRDYAPEEVSAEILKKLKRDAERFLGGEVAKAVITVPAYFNDAQRNATKRAGELAGFAVERIVNEPTAAALAYGLERLSERSRIAVYDLGGGTFDLSILELNNGVFQVLATHGSTRLGGDDLDRRVAEFLVEKIVGAGGPDLRPCLTPGIGLPLDVAAQLARVREAAEEAKIELSTKEEVVVSVPFLAPKFSFSMELTREQLEGLTRDIIGRTRSHCLRSLTDAKVEPEDLDRVILVGGQTRMPLVRQFVRDLFGCTEFEETRGGIRLGTEYHRREGPQLNTSQNPDEAVALGAAIQAEILAGGFRNMLLLDVTPLSLGIETFGGLMSVLIPRNSTIPVKAGEMFTAAIDYQREMLIHVLQGERERSVDNWSLGKFTIEFESAPRGVARVGVQFEIDANGILHVLARDIRTGKDTTVEITSAVDVEDSAVYQMVEESVEHAFEDMAARRWIEARLKGEELVKATRKALTDCGEEIQTELRQRVEAGVKEVERLVESGQGGGIGDAAALKAACAQLDDATRPMAEILMDRAMEAVLRKRGLIE